MSASRCGWSGFQPAGLGSRCPTSRSVLPTLVVGLIVVVVPVLSGCQTLRVKLALRDFARAAKRRDRKALAARSTDGLDKAVWRRIPPALWKMHWPKSGSSKKSGRSDSSSSPKVSVHVQGRRATAEVRWKGLVLHFAFAKENGWKVDDVSATWKGSGNVNRIELRRDIQPVLTVYEFAMAAYHGDKDRMVQLSSRRLLAGGWDALPESLFRRVSNRLRAPSKGPSTGPAEHVSAVSFRRIGKAGRCSIGVTMSSGRRIEVLVRATDKGWLVDDAVYQEPRDKDGPRRLHLSHLLASARALYDLGKRLVSSDLVDVKSIRSRIEPKQAGGPAAPRPRRPSSRRAKLDFVSDFVSHLSVEDFDDQHQRLWIAFSWKDARGRIDFGSVQGRWKVLDARLDRAGRSIRLADALGIRDLLVSLMKAALRVNISRIQALSSPELNRLVWVRLGPIERLKKRLLAGGLDELLGFAALPKNVLAKLGFGARVAMLARRIASGRLRLVGLWRQGNRAFLVIRIGSVPVTVRTVMLAGSWRLDDISWRIGGRTISFAKRTNALLGAWFGPGR